MDGDLSIVTSHLINVCVLSCFSPVQLCGTLWTVARQVPLSIGFSRQEYWSGLPCPSPGELPDPEMESASLLSPAFVGRFFFFFLPLVLPGKPHLTYRRNLMIRWGQPACLNLPTSLILDSARRKRREIKVQSCSELGPSKEWGHHMGRIWLGCSCLCTYIQKVSKDSAAQNGWYEPKASLMSSLNLVSGSDIADLLIAFCPEIVPVFISCYNWFSGVACVKQTFFVSTASRFPSLSLHSVDPNPNKL